MKTGWSHVSIDLAGDIATVRMHDEHGGPVQWNVGSQQDLGEAFWELVRDRQLKAVILTGTGDHFVKADELEDQMVSLELAERRNGVNDWDAIEADNNVLMHGHLSIEVPIIAAVNGPALMHPEMAALCDIVLAVPSASFRDGHMRNGFVPGDGAHIVWPALIGMNRGRHFLLTGHLMSSQEALDWGVVNEIVEPDGLMARADEYAEWFTRHSRAVLKGARLATTLPIRRAFAADLGYGVALEGIGAFVGFRGPDLGPSG
jgi:enoyl-CoA hydratase/carnithine racemase